MIPIPIYLDNAATTKVAPEVLEAMLPYLTDNYGNAGSIHTLGRKAAEAIATARRQVANLFRAEPEQIIFTSGGSEGNSMVFSGLRDKLLAEGKTHIIVSAIEHESVLNAAQSLIKHGFQVTYLQPGKGGYIAARSLIEAITEKTGLVSVMCINNETGACNSIDEIGEVCAYCGILLHSDCVQAYEEIRTDAITHNVDFATISGHKFHAPKGIGALFVKEPNLAPLIYGGTNQEFGLRGGTENIASIVGLGAACELFKTSRRQSLIAPRRNTDFTDIIKQCIGRNSMTINSLLWSAYGNILSLTFDGVDAESLVLMLDSKGVYVSAGSACQSHEAKPSHVLTAMGLSEQAARSTIRVSFSRYNTEEEIVEAAKIVAECVKALRGEAS